MIGDTLVCKLHAVKVVVPIGYSTTLHQGTILNDMEPYSSLEMWKRVLTLKPFFMGLTFGNTCLLLY